MASNEAFINNQFKEGNSGKPKGALNKSTKERNAAFREKLLESSIVYHAVNELQRRLTEEPEKVKTSEIINLITKVGSFLYQTVSEENQDEVIAQITTRDQAEAELSKLKDAVTLLRAVK